MSHDAVVIVDVTELNVEQLVASANEGAQSGIITSLGQNSQVAQTLVNAATTSAEEAVASADIDTASVSEPPAETSLEEGASPG